jgi:hypothetical protein
MVTPFLDHSSALLRAMAIWALRQLADDDIWQGLREIICPMNAIKRCVANGKITSSILRIIQ